METTPVNQPDETNEGSNSGTQNGRIGDDPTNNTETLKFDDLTAPATTCSGRDVQLRAGQRFGSYRLLRLLGKGGFGHVWEGESEDSGRRIAIKVLTAGASASPEMGQR